MALPPGVTPKTVTVGVASFFDGSLAEGTVSITAPVNVVHNTSNRPIFSSKMTKRFVDGEVSFDLCPTDAAGLNRVDWTYKLNVTVQGAITQPDPIYFTLPEAGPDVIDLDALVPVPSSAGTPISVAVLTADDLDGYTAQYVGDDTSETSVALRAAFVSPAKLPLPAPALWEPPAQDPADTTYPGLAAWSAADFITNLWEPLRAAAPGYVTRTSLGKDASGTHDVWRYVFTPESGVYDRTVVVTGAIHGGEVLGSVAVARMLHYAITDPEAHPELAQLRYRTRLVVIPIANPWGVSNGRTRRNSRGVDLNRNFDYQWSAYADGGSGSQTYKGTAPFSEVETQYVRDALLAYPDVTGYLDLHDFGAQLVANAHAFISWQPDWTLGPDTSWLYRVMNGMDPDRSERRLLSNVPDPNGHNWAAATLGVNAGLIEFENGWASGTAMDAAHMTAQVKWFGNCLAELAKQAKPVVAKPREPFVYDMDFTTGATTVTFGASANADEELEELRIEVPIPGPGILTYSGTISVYGVVGTYFITPAVGSTSGPVQPVAHTWNERAFKSATATDRITIPFQLSCPVTPQEDTNAGTVLVAALYARCSAAGTSYVYRYQGQLKYEPSDGGSRYRRYTATGRGGGGVGAMQQQVL